MWRESGRGARKVPGIQGYIRAVVGVRPPPILDFLAQDRLRRARTNALPSVNKVKLLSVGVADGDNRTRIHDQRAPGDFGICHRALLLGRHKDDRLADGADPGLRVIDHEPRRIPHLFRHQRVPVRHTHEHFERQHIHQRNLLLFIKKIPVLDALPNLNHRRPRQQHRIKKHLQRQRQHINHQHRRAPRPRQIRLIARLHAPQQPLRRQLQLPQPRRYPHRHRHGPDLAVVRRRGRVQRPPLLQRQPMPRGVLPLVLHELLNRGPPEVIIPLHAIVNRLDKVVRP
mmetsp:Transcript_16772/g.43189  ORF Transcript_16772/g.43189 Transcript_16772/m.43189 type:complete len:285 (-) Transcript_16772:200-1054(-)